MLFSQQKSIVGVDIGTSYIKVSQITHNETTRVLDTYGIVNMPPHVKGEETGVKVKETAALLSNLLDKANVNAKYCVASLPNSAVFTSVIDLPVMNEGELESAMQYEAKKYVPLPFSEIDLSWAVLPAIDESNKTTMKVLIIAAPKLIKESYLQVFSLTGLNLEIIEIEALSLIRSLIIDHDKTSVIIDIGAKATGINIIKSGQLQLTRNMNVGGDTITDRIAQTLNITRLRAEQFKKDFGVSETEFLPEAIKPIFASIKNEIKQLLAIYKSHNAKVDNIVLVGGGAQLPGIKEVFADLELQVEIGNPLNTVAYPEAGASLLRRYALQLPIAIGLALRNET